MLFDVTVTDFLFLLFIHHCVNVSDVLNQSLYFVSYLQKEDVVLEVRRSLRPRAVQTYKDYSDEEEEEEEEDDESQARPRPIDARYTRAPPIGARPQSKQV